MKRSKGKHSLLRKSPKKESKMRKDVANYSDGSGGTQDEQTAEVKETLEGLVEITKVMEDTEIKSPSCLNQRPSKVKPVNVKQDLEMVEHSRVQTKKSMSPRTSTNVPVPTLDIAINTTEVKDLFEEDISISRSYTSQGVDPCFSASPGAWIFTVGHKVWKISEGKSKRQASSDPAHKERLRELTQNIIAEYKKKQEQKKALENAEDTNVDAKTTNIFTKPYEVWGYVRDSMIDPIWSMIKQEPEQTEETNEVDIAKSGFFSNIVHSAARIVTSITSPQSYEDYSEYSDDEKRGSDAKECAEHAIQTVEAHLSEQEYIKTFLEFKTEVRPIYEIRPDITKDRKATKKKSRPQTLDPSKEVKREATTVESSLKKINEIKLQMIGMFADGIRRTDLVLVMPIDLPVKHEHIRMEFLNELVKQGIHIETEEAVLKKNKNYMFVKLHATDLCLHNYADILGIKKYFRDNNENVVYESRKKFWNRLMKRGGEIRWLKRIRALQKDELGLSTLDRSYIVHIIVQHLRFGKPKNYYGIHRLMQKKIFVDVYALHETVPYRSGRGMTIEELSNRQMLCKKWYSWFNLLKDQPHHLIYEYFGSRIAFYFIFYELYNKALLIASMWGAFMTMIYIIKDPEYLNHTRESSFRERIGERSAVCAACEGEGGNKLHCPFTAVHDYCFDIMLMSYFDSPYMIIHSVGIAVLVQMMWRRWQQISVYWHWVWEEHESEPQVRPQHKPYHASVVWLIVQKAVAIVRSIAFEIILPCFIFLIPVPLILLSLVWTYQYVWKLTVKDISGEQPNVKEMMEDKEIYNMGLMLMDKKMEYGILVAIAAAVQIVLFVLEKIFHCILTIVTKVENHRTHANYERSLASKLFLVSLFYSSSTVIYFGWLKGTFYYSPFGQVNLVFETITGNRYEMAKLPTLLFTLIRRAMYLHCGPFSCFRQAVGAFFVTIVIRIVLVPVIGNLIRRRPRPMNIRKGYVDTSEWVPTAELEKNLLPLTEERITKDYNSLMLQVALVFLFTPMFPLAPLIALIVNYFDIRIKARSYLLHSRRALLHRRGLGASNNLFWIIALAVPFFHGLTLCKTEVFKKYVFYKAFNQPYFKPKSARDGYFEKDPWWDVEDMFTNFLLHMNYYFDNVRNIRLCTGCAAVYNGERLVDATADNQRNVRIFPFNTGLKGPPRIYSFLEVNRRQLIPAVWPTSFLYKLIGCRMDGFFDFISKEQDSILWPMKWNYMKEKNSKNAPSQDHYHLLYVKTVFFICFLMFIGFLSLILRSKMNALYHSVGRRLYRQKVLHRNRLNELRFLASDRNYDNIIKRAKTIQRRIQK